jgi:uncharacterized protein DUF6268
MFAATHPRRIAFTLALAATALYPALAHAQAAELKPARLEYEFYPGSRVSGLSRAGGESDVHFHAARASLSVPTLVGKETLLIPGLKYQLLDVGAESPAGSAQTGSVEALHSLMLSIGVLQPLGGDFSLFAQLGGGLAGDLSSEPTSEDWVVSAQALGLWAVTHDFTLGAGVGYDRRTGEVAPLPLVAFSWEPEPDLLVRGVLPQFFSLRYRLATPVTLGLEAGMDGERYHLSEQNLGLSHAEVAHSVIKAGPSVTVHWTNWFHTRLAGGVVASRRFELYVDDISQGDLDVSHGPFAGIELWFGPSGWSSDAVETAIGTAGAGSRQRQPSPGEPEGPLSLR